jgi:hypothetical protein
MGLGRGVVVLLALGVWQASTAAGTMVAHGAGTEVPSRHTAPSALTLTSSDVHQVTGETFSHLGGALVTNAQVAAIEKVSLATMNRYRLTGYLTSFVSGAASGILLIQDSVGLYKSDAAAQWQYNLFTNENKPPKGSGTISMSGVGNQARGYTTAGGASVYLRRGIFTARLDIAALGVAVGPIALRLSKILDGRMKAGK